MQYIKVWVDKWFTGSTRWELTAEERAIWVDFLVLAGQHNPPGEFEFAGDEHLANLCRVSIEVIKRAVDKFEQTGKIEIIHKIEPQDPAKSKCIIIKWNEYQPTYPRKESKEETEEDLFDEK